MEEAPWKDDGHLAVPDISRFSGTRSSGAHTQ
jgi:hypothetical protein